MKKEVEDNQMSNQTTRGHIYKGDDLDFVIKGYVAKPQEVPFGTKVEGVLFDGYPQLIKQESSQPQYALKAEKDIKVPMRDGIHLYTDVYRPDVEGEKFPALLAYAGWSKDVNAAIDWLAEYPQPYFESPLWDGTLEACNFNYTVPRGFIHVIPDPRGIGNSEGYGTKPWFNSEDVYDMIEWIAAQPWCDGKVGMIGPSAYSIMQIHGATLKPPHLVALRADECGCGTWDHFTGVIDLMAPYAIVSGTHCNDSPESVPNYEYTPLAPSTFSHPDINARLAEALAHPDFKYNTRWYSFLTNPRKFPQFFDYVLETLHPEPGALSYRFQNEDNVDKIDVPIYLGTPWNQRLYNFKAFDTWRTVSTPDQNKKMIVYPPGFSARPYMQYHDEMIRWNDYWLKGKDTGIMDEPPVKLFVMGINKWRFENEWPLKRTKWANYYLQPGGGLAPTALGTAEPEILDQPAPYLDPTVYCLRYRTAPFEKDTEVTGPVTLNLTAAIDIDDTNWFVDLVDVDENGREQLLSWGALKAQHRALDVEKSKPYYPVHPLAEPVPVKPGEILEYNIALMPMSCVFQKGHRLELIIRNQDDLMSRLASWGVKHLPFMRSVKHEIHFGKSHLFLPMID
ncbi:CocE/NonD family hydrolase [Roseomonas mucosa]